VGVHINAAVIGDGNIQMTMPLPAYATYWNNVLGLNESFLNDLNTLADECGFTSYIDEHLVYPPPKEPSTQLSLEDDETTEERCSIWLPLREAAELVNPCFNIYHIVDTCPWPS
jgi:carboxypeptidase D